MPGAQARPPGHPVAVRRSAPLGGALLRSRDAGPPDSKGRAGHAAWGGPVTGGMIMTQNQDLNASSPAALGGGAASSTGNPDRTAPPSALVVPDGLPRLIVRAVAGFSVVDIVNAEILLEEGTIRGLSTQLHRLIEEGHTRLLLNFGGVRYMSSAVLATLAGLHRRLERAQAR